MPEPIDILISYAREDRARVEPLAKPLEAKGWRVWWDPKIPPGRTWHDVIEEAVTNAQCIRVLWSKTGGSFVVNYQSPVDSHLIVQGTYTMVQWREVTT